MLAYASTWQKCLVPPLVLCQCCFFGASYYNFIQQRGVGIVPRVGIVSRVCIVLGDIRYMIYWIELLISKSRGNKIYVSGQDKVVLTIYALKHTYISSTILIQLGYSSKWAYVEVGQAFMQIEGWVEHKTHLHQIKECLQLLWKWVTTSYLTKLALL